MLNMNFRRPSVPDKDECKYLQLQGNGCFDGAFKASHESILLEVGLFSFGAVKLCGFGLFKLPLL